LNSILFVSLATFRLYEIMSKPKPIVKEAFVAEKIKEEIQNGLIGKNEVLIERILFHDNDICTQLGIDKKYKSSTIDKSTLYRFLQKFDISKTRERTNKKSKKNQSIVDILDEDDDNETRAPTENKMKGAENSSTSPSVFEKLLLEEEGGTNNESKDIIIQYQGEKIRELTKICSGLSNKIPPSSMVSNLSTASIDKEDDVGENIIELEQSRTLHLCIRAFIQVLSPIKVLTEWIIENDFLIVQGMTPDDPFQQLANTWFWDGILKYESLEDNADKVKILHRFGYNLKKLCQMNDQVFGTSYTSAANHGTNNLGFIPPPPQRLLDMIIQQHYNHFLDFDELGPDGQMYDLPNLPFKKIQLVPPINTKPFGRVSFCSWRPKHEDLFFDQKEEDDDSEEDSLSNKSPPPPEILFAELSFDREKLTYVHFEWPHFEEDVILEGEKFYSDYHQQQKKRVSQKIIHNKHQPPRFDYQMIGVIWGRQFPGDWEGFRQDGLLPHLGAHKHPVTYIYATKRNTSSKNPKQGRWYLCLDDNYVSFFKPKELTNNFQDVLLYMDNNHRRTYRPQLLVFQKISKLAQGPQDDSPISIHQYEPSLHKNMISSVVAVPLKKNSSSQEESSLLACCRSRTTATTEPAVVEKKKPKPKPKKKSSITTLLRPNLQLASKKKLLEAIDLLCDHAVPISREALNNDERFFGFDKASDYQKGPSGFQIKQTEDQKRYYAALANLKKK
jgi:hypothetical protein